MVVTWNLSNTQSKIIPHTHQVSDITNFPTDVSYFNNDAGYITKDVNDLTNYYKKTEVYTKWETDTAISTAVASVYRYKGSVADYDHLPVSGMVVWDVYNVEAAHDTEPKFDAGTNVAWNGSAWDPLAWDVDLSHYYTKDEVDALIPSVSYTKAQINTMTWLNDAVASFDWVSSVVDQSTHQITATDVLNTDIEDALEKDADSIKKIVSAYNALETRTDTNETNIANAQTAIANMYTKTEINTMTGLNDATAGFVSNTLTEGADGKIAIVNNSNKTISAAETDNKAAIEVLANAHWNLVDRVASLETGDDESTRWISVNMSGTETTKQDAFVTTTSVVIPTYGSTPNGHINLFVDNGSVKITSTASENMTVYLCIIKNPLVQSNWGNTEPVGN